MRTALITGITGQDGSYLAEFLLEKGYEVHGIIRRASSFNTGRINHLFEDPHKANAHLHLHYGDVMDGTGLRRIISQSMPDEIYNLAAQSHVRVSFDQAEFTGDVVAMGALRLLEAVREHNRDERADTRIYQAGSSEMFGASAAPQDEATRFAPRSPYAVSKVAAHHFAVNYREAYGMFVANGILFNHESPRRGETFVTRKITRALGRIRHGLQQTLYLGNLEARRDWGYAPDFVDAMWRMLQQDQPDDFVIATGQSFSVRDFLEAAAAAAGVAWEEHLEIDPRYYRPTEVEHLEGNATKARQMLGWKPSMSFEGLVKSMVDADMAIARDERLVRDARTNTEGARRPELP